MRIEFEARSYADVACDLLAYPVFEDQLKKASSLKGLVKATQGVAATVLATGEFKPELHRTCLIHRPARLKARRLLLIGAGKEREFNLARLREVAGTAARVARQARCKSIAFLMRGGFPSAESARVSVEGALHGNYESEIYKTREIETREAEALVLLSEGKTRRHQAEEGIRRGTIVGNAVNFARSLGNEPANILTPSQLAERALAVGARTGLEVSILEPEEIEKLGMNALLAVSRGSNQPPKLIILRIPGQKPQKGAPVFALVGKGVTFDSGGISIKPAEKMEDMKADMAGGAAVLAAMAALAELGSLHAVIGLIPAVENLPSGNATKPGDIVKSYLGKTIEIINTDAEGRLILADALAYARTLGATRLIDIATLTGACVIALGHINAGMMGTDQEILERLRCGARLTGERFWQLPLDDDYRKAIRSEIADIKNVGNRWGGAITAAKFLQEFVEGTPWVHLDIAGVDLDHDGQPFAAKGATGFGVRSLIQLFT
ncbi:MAG: leucyl aminopeptidase [Acidobacteriia bacterium]|nr:leucyl aminopeptidase [Terriglobia bacterium]